MNLLNTTINGYKLIQFIGEGGFGSVYKAEKNNQYFAIKIFRETYVLEEFRKGGDNRITREIQIIQSVQHEHLVQYVDHFMVDVLSVPQVFIVMEFLDGVTLRDMIRSNSWQQLDKADVFIKIMDGISALHKANIIHRDLKPENIMVLPDRVKILDYGLAKLIDYTSITSTGNILGSFAYMSPEQITDSKNIDHRSDLYSVGVVFYEMLTGKLPFEATLVPEFIDKIKNELPTPPRRWERNISNQHENIVLKLLEKDPYKRYPDVATILNEFQGIGVKPDAIAVDLSPRFVLRTYNEKAVLEQFIQDHSGTTLYVDFPVNHQSKQKGLLSLVQQHAILMIDPATIRLAYDTYTDVKGLLQLPYCPTDYSVIEPSYLSSFSKQKEYVKAVIDEQVKLQANILTSPYHYSHNTNVTPTAKRNPVAEWFDLDIKLLKEAIDYRNNTPALAAKPLYAGICINANSLNDPQYKRDLLNTYASLRCDGFLVYADGISKDSTEITLYHYISTLVELQRYTSKPVIAGRLDMLGLGLICSGITGFTSGVARFESFYEDLYKATGDTYNMYERYYFPELLGTIAITKKDPIRLQQIISVLGQCDCRYCTGKPIPGLIESKNNKLHFLELIHSEINQIKTLSTNKDRLNYFISRIDETIINYQKLQTVFKPTDYGHLIRWKNVFTKIGTQYV